MKLSQIAEKTGATLIGDASAEILRVSTIEQAVIGDLTFVANSRYNHFLESTQASAVILSKAIETSRLNLLVHPDPYYAFSVVLTLFYPKPGSHLKSGIAANAVIAPTATIGTNVHVGNFVEIGEGAVPLVRGSRLAEIVCSIPMLQSTTVVFSVIRLPFIPAR